MRILQIRQIKRSRGEASPEDRVLDLSGSGFLSLEAFGDGNALLDILCLALYGRHAPRSEGVPSPIGREESREREFEVLFEVGGEGAPAVRYRASCLLYRGGEGFLPGRRTLRRIEGTEEQELDASAEAVSGLSPEAFLRSALLRRSAFSALLGTEPQARAPMLDALLGDGLYACIPSLAYEKYRAEKEERRARGEVPESVDGTEERRSELSEVLRELRESENGRGACAAVSQEAGIARAERELRDLDRRKADWEKEMALFAPDRRRLEQARQALELAEAHRSLSVLRKEQERDRLEQMSLNADLNRYRDETRTAEEAFNLAEVALRDRLVKQKKLAETIRTVRELDQQAQDRQDSVQEVRGQLQSLETALGGISERAEREQADLERLGISLRDVRKYLQSNPADEKLAAALEGMRKCFGLFCRAQEARKALRENYEKALRNRQESQNALNDRQAMFSDISHRFGVVEKNFERAQAFFGGTLKGKPMDEWRGICSHNEKRIQEMDRLAADLYRERDIQEEMRQLLDRRLKMESEQRELGMKEADRAARVERMEEARHQLERRVELLQRIDSMDDMRRLLKEAAPCPLCGSLSHPYVVGNVPDSSEVRRQLDEADRELGVLREEAVARLGRAGQLEEEILSVGRIEEELRREAASLNDSITGEVASLGLKFGVGASPLEELGRVRQKALDQMQRARDVLSSAEQAERDLLAAKDELERIRGSQEELTRFHQEALSDLKRSQGEVERLEKEIRSHEESFNSVRRELIGQFSLFGYKSLPDDNPGRLLELLEARSDAWTRRTEEKEGLERSLCAAQASLQALQKEKEALRAEVGSRADLIKRLEAERDALHQQRVVLFAAKDPRAEEARMEASVEEARRQLEQRRETKNETRDRLEEVMIRLHDLETVQATRRERLQKEEIAFGKGLLAKGFRNEDDYLSSCLPEEERKALQDRLRELSKIGFEIGSSRDDARFAQAELRSLSLSPAGAGGTPVDLPELLERAGTLYLELGPDAEGERLYREYGDALSPLRPAGSHQEMDAALRAYGRGLALDAIMRRANGRLERGGFPCRLLREAGAPGVVLRDEGRPGLPLSGAGLSGPEERTVTLALAWGLCDLFAWEGGGTNLRVWDARPEDEEPGVRDLLNAFCGDGERVCLGS